MARYVFLGAPGVGKGTQAVRFSSYMSLAHISTGEMLRQSVNAGSELGEQVKGIIESGQLIPDSLMVKIIEERIEREDCRKGYVLDGFPRTVPQAEALEMMLGRLSTPLNAVVLFDADEGALIARLSHRREAEARQDDSAEVQQKRLVVYREQTAPLIDYYEKLGLLVRVDGSGSVEQVFGNLKSALGV